MKEETKDLIDNLLCTVPIEINYKHDIFLKETVAYAKYETKQLHAQRYVKNKKLSTKYKKLLAEKRAITFIDIKLDIINNHGEDKLKELENNYIHLATITASNADSNLADFFKDDIASKFVNFIFELDEVKKNITKLNREVKLAEKRKIKKNKTSNNVDVSDTSKDNKKDKVSFYSDIIDKNMSLVYKNMKLKGKSSKNEDSHQSEYLFKTLDTLLDAIAKSSICYCIGGKDYSALNKIKDVSKPSREKVVPLFIRRVCALTCYALLEFGNHISIVTLGKQISKGTGITSQIMNDLHERCIDLGYPYFKNTNKVFQYDKWSIVPDEMLRKRTYIPPKIPISYAGMKVGWLGYMISELQKQVPYKKFLDAFGGSGASSVQFRHNKDAEYYINDFHFANVSYYKVLLAPEKEYKQFLGCLGVIKKCVQIALDNMESGNWTKKVFNEHIGRLYNIYNKVSDVCVNEKSLEYVVCNGVCFDFVSTITSIDASYTGCNYASYIIVAAVFVAFSIMNVNGLITKNLGKDSAKKLANKDINKIKMDFDSLRLEFKGINIVDDFGEDVIKLLNRSDFNNDTTLVYLDSPYIGTAEYNASKDSGTSKYPKGTIIDAKDCGKDFISTDFRMDDLLDVCDNYKGSFIFSCRLNMPNPDLSSIILNMTKKGKSYDSICRNYNNYLWFFNRWLNMKNIDNYYMYCMVDTDWSLLQNTSTLWYTQSPFERSADMVFKNKFINADWGIDLSEDFKEKVFDYLRAIILTGTNYEVFITNKNYKTPVFDNMYGILTNPYDKGGASTQFKYKKEGEIKHDGKIIEMQIPNNGMFIKIPMKLVAELVLTELKDVRRSFKIK